MSTANYEFTWPAGPKDVVLTGKFDHWKASMPLVKQADGSFALTFPVTTSEDDKFVFKFIVDGDWTVNDKYKKESDGSGHENNYIAAEDCAKVSAAAVSAGSTVIPESGALPAATQSGSSTPAGTPTANAGRAPPSTSNRKKGKKGKKMKVKKRIRRNKKTGERTVVAQETEEMDSSANNTPVEGDDEIETETDGKVSSSSTPAPENVPAEEEKKKEQEVHILPVDQNKATTQFEDTTAIAQSAPGPALVANPEEVKEFTEVSEVDAKELNERLNKELKEEEENEKVAEAAEEAKAKVEKPVAETKAEVEEKVEEAKAVIEEPVAETEAKVEESVATLDPKKTVSATEPAVAAEETAEAVEETAAEEITPEVTEAVKEAVEPVKQEAKKPTTTQKAASSKKTSSTKKTATPAAKKTEEKPKKKGIFGKLKSLFK